MIRMGESMLRFVYPTESDRRAVQAFYSEFEEQNETCIGYNGYKDFDRWLKGMHGRITMTDLPEGFVQEAFYLCYDGAELVGVLSLKFTLTPYLMNYGGHIGYAVKPSRRRRGLATRMLRQSLDIARGMGMEKLLLVCDNGNIASEKTILRCGGIYEDTRHDSDEDVDVRRFWITL